MASLTRRILRNLSPSAVSRAEEKSRAARVARGLPPDPPTAERSKPQRNKRARHVS